MIESCLCGSGVAPNRGGGRVDMRRSRGARSWIDSTIEPLSRAFMSFASSPYREACRSSRCMGLSKRSGAGKLSECVPGNLLSESVRRSSVAVSRKRKIDPLE